MVMAERRAEVTWRGDLTSGEGTFTVGSGALGTQSVSWPARTEKPDGKTSPEELIAAAHASCFSMALSNILAKQDTPPEQLDVTAVCTLDRVEGAARITKMDLNVRGQVPDVDQAAFEKAAKQAKDGCPVSNALMNNVELSVTAELVQ
jgi:osmotically inducible protein OsmC